MTQKDIIEKTAAGLRRMDKKPDFLLFMKFHMEDDTVYDQNKICDIPVIHTDEFLHSLDDKDCPFYPCWHTEGDYTMETYHFRRGYEENC